ncbi:hypothetical protein AB0M80_16440 [Amycolatopsis sp. NPDC051045]|uniref:hypothetical protein n=1 Tax=Amycolatopsis sp. NPDC051045 TaxID=3156922 RepID=UPI0034481FB7
MLGIFRPDLPATLLGFLRRVPVGKGTVPAAGELVVLWLTFVDTHPAGTVDVGLAVPEPSREAA